MRPLVRAIMATRVAKLTSLVVMARSLEQGRLPSGRCRRGEWGAALFCVRGGSSGPQACRRVSPRGGV